MENNNLNTSNEASASSHNIGVEKHKEKTLTKARKKEIHEFLLKKREKKAKAKRVNRIIQQEKRRKYEKENKVHGYIVYTNIKSVAIYEAYFVNDLNTDNYKSVSKKITVYDYAGKNKKEITRKEMCYFPIKHTTFCTTLQTAIVEATNLKEERKIKQQAKKKEMIKELSDTFSLSQFSSLYVDEECKGLFAKIGITKGYVSYIKRYIREEKIQESEIKTIFGLYTKKIKYYTMGKIKEYLKNLHKEYNNNTNNNTRSI